MSEEKGITAEIARLATLKENGFWMQLKTIASRREFYLYEEGIYITGGKESEDFIHQVHAARKAVQHGYMVYILPNPKAFRSADFIFVRKNVYKLFDLKTITGRNSVGNRLEESVGQSNRVVLNLAVNYPVENLSKEIKSFFDANPSALEIVILKGNKWISILRDTTLSPKFHKIIRKALHQ